MCTKFNLKIDESTELLDTKTFDDYYTNELLLLSGTIKQSCEYNGWASPSNTVK